MTKTPKHLISAKFVALVSCVDLAYFSLANPGSANAAVIIAGVCLLVISTYSWVAIAVRVGAAFWPVGLRTQRRIATSLAAVGVLLVLMQSIGQLDWRDVLAIVPLAAALYVYLSYLAAEPSAAK